MAEKVIDGARCPACGTGRCVAFVLIDLPCYRCKSCGCWGRWHTPSGKPDLIPKDNGIDRLSDVPITGPTGDFYSRLRDAALL